MSSSHPISKDSLVVVGKAGSKEILGKDYQKDVIQREVKYVKLVHTPALVTTALNSGGVHEIYIQRGAVKGPIESLMLSFDITITGASAYLAATSDWFDRIEILNRGGKELQRYYPETIKAAWAVQGEKWLERYAEQICWNPKTGNEVNKPHAQNAKRTYLLPLPNAIWEDSKFYDFETATSDLEIRLYTRAGGIISRDVGALLNTSAVAAVNEVAFRMEISRLHDMKEIESEKQLRKSKVFAHRYLSTDRLSVAHTAAASTTFEIDLDQFRGQSAGLIVARRVVATKDDCEANRCNQYLGFGDLTTIDIKDEAGVSTYGNGRPVTVEFLQAKNNDWLPDMFQSYQEILYIPFSLDMAGAIAAGAMDGFHTFNKDKQTLSIGYAAASTPEVQTLTLDGAAMSDGFYNLIFDNEATASLAHNTSAANIAAAVNGLKTMWKRGWVVAVSAALSAGTTVTFTFTDRAGNVIDTQGLSLSVQLGPTVAGATGAGVAVTTVPVFAGPTVLTAATLDIYSLHYTESYLDSGSIVSARM